MAMYLIIVVKADEKEYYGPFPSERRAKEYAEQFGDEATWIIVPIIVPNCVQVRVMY